MKLLLMISVLKRCFDQILIMLNISSLQIGTPSPGGSGLKKHQQPTPRGGCMTTVQEELEQSTEDIAKATEENLQCKTDLNLKS